MERACHRRLEKGSAMADNDMLDLVIIGGGAAGYTAAIYAARAAMDVVVIEQGMPGGQIATTDVIENYPGIPTISGSELGIRFQEHAESLGVETRYAMAIGLERTDDGFQIDLDGTIVHARTVIVATGAQPRTAGFEGEDRFRGRGVSYCATCDGMFYRGKRVFVIGGGNAACEEGLYLAGIASEVVMVLRRDVFRAPRGVVEELLAADNVNVRYSTSIVAVDGANAISQITFRDNATGSESTEAFDEGSIGIFVFAGTDPAVDIAADLVELGGDGGILTDEDMATATPGLFAAGDVRSKRLRQVVTAAADGAIAATSAYRFINGS